MRQQPLGAAGLLLALGLLASDAVAIYQSDLVKEVPLTSAAHSTATVDSDTSNYAYALNRFYLGYPSGDHKLRRLRYMPVGKKLEVALADQNGDDAFKYRGKHVILVNTLDTRETAKNGCMNECTLAYSYSTTSVFVLTGFDLNRHDGDDNVSEIGILPDRAKGEIKVTLKSSTHPFDAKIRYALLPKKQTYEQLEVSGTHPRGKESAFFHYDGGLVSENAFLRLPLKRLQTGSLGGTPDPLVPCLTCLPLYAPPVLQGFWFKFKNGDHHIGEIAVDVEGGLATVKLNDQNYDDPFEARVRYALIK